jgi:hypothetical protein
VSLREGCGRAILNLEGGVRQDLDVDLHGDDVYDEIEQVPKVSPDRLEDLVRRNSFGIKKTVPDGSSPGIAVYHVPSFFNHSCMPNTVHYHIGDMIFIVSSTTIPAGSEIFLTYYPFLHQYSLQERNTQLQKRTGGFSCRCALCRFEIENPSIVVPAAKVVKNIADKFKARKGRRSMKVVQGLKEARRYLFKQFDVPISDYDKHKVPIFDTKSPRKFSFAKLLLPILWMLEASLGEKPYEERLPYIVEIHALMKDNLHFTCLEPLEAPKHAMTVWSHHHRRSHPKVATLWLEELKSICSLVGGKKLYEGKFLPLVSDEITRHPSKESGEAYI